MKKISRHLLLIPVTCAVAAVLPLHAKAQEPDLSKLTAYDDKIKAWVDYCEFLRLNSSGAKNNYVLLQQAGWRGLQMAKPDDATGRSKFFMYAGLGNYYQIRFDSAQYYFYQCPA